MTFIDENFLLHNKTAEKLYHEVAKDQPIFDYHSHLLPQDAAENRRFKNLSEIWLEADHYKWRAMRCNGIAEAYCTGNAEPYEKFLAYAKVVPQMLRNPIYHWTHLELSRFLGIDTLLSEKTAEAVWNEANEKLQTEALSTWGILKSSRVNVFCTTDDPADSLEHHKAIRANAEVPTKVYPTFRPEKATQISDPENWNGWCDRLASAADMDVSSLEQFKAALKARHDAFHAVGGRLSDHSLPHCYDDFCSDSEAAAIFEKARAGKAIDSNDDSKFISHMMLFFGTLDAEKGWTQQLHLGALRNNSTRLFNALGPDTGFDSMDDSLQGQKLSNYLNELDKQDKLPRTILYNLNPTNNYLFAAMTGNFHDGTIAGKIQFGAAWWFNDQKEGIEAHLNALSNLCVLSRFVGMLTDSRSFLSMSRHEYFRRILCNMIGDDVEKGELPNDWGLLSELIGNICYDNAERYFGLEV